MKFIQSILLLPMVCGACTPTHSTRYTIEGEGVDSVLNGRYLYLQRYDDRSIIDSAKVVNQRYVFHGDIDTAVYCYIDTKSWSTAQFMLEPGTIHIHTENRYSSVKGTVLNDSWACWNAKTDCLLAEIKEQQHKFQPLRSPSDTLQERWTTHYRKALYPQLAQHFQQAMQLHPQDAFGYALLSSSSMRSLALEDQLDLFQTAGSYIQNTRMYRYKRQMLDAAIKTRVGQRFVNLQGKNPSGKETALADYVGKGHYVLVDFWASWCKPCLEEMNYLHQLQEQYGNRNLRIVGINTEDSFEDFARTVRDKKLTWSQIHDSQETALNQYGIEGIPFLLLLSPDGVIVERNLRGERMIQRVQQQLEKEQPSENAT